MYAGYEYYSIEYGGKLKEDEYTRLVKKADRVLDKLTHNRLQNFFPTDEQSIDNVYQCECELVDYEYYIDKAKEAQANGEVIKSVSSGSESVTYDTSIYSEAVRSEASHIQHALDICRTWIGGIPDSKGVNLLYAGL